MPASNPPTVTSAVAVLLGGLAVVTLAGCGRSAPEGAAGADGGIEPGMAGIEVVSDEPVVSPSATAVAVSTTATSTSMAVAATSAYVVQPGDTLSVIAERFGVPLADLSAANDITDVNTIRPGQELVIPQP